MQRTSSRAAFQIKARRTSSPGGPFFQSPTSTSPPETGSIFVRENAFAGALRHPGLPAVEVGKRPRAAEFTTALRA